ncbi:TPA: hypothetical protein U1V26_001510 [Streptococcus suis]|uniref:hypothetical protein n=1 Tax=Streptococcus suis TaxID=1307 RepID=UPI000C193EE9|nr:hypothetical protein [Streptococcus suis]HEL2651249.1 hypothetical protein [Streptococcus suis]HEM3931771.1 hypothetical protein [Streptococcus suis]HEM3945712.1 hypothetical protein [Streptococcus suis]HEM3959648.1 hypothetical protein [Streptococcus suis]
MGISDLKENSIELTTKLQVQDIAYILQEICAEWKTTPEAIQSSSAALAAFDNRADIEVAIHGKAGLFSPQLYAVQVYVYDLENERGIEIVALGNSGLAKFLYGAAGAVKMSESIKRRDMIAERIMRHAAQ